MTRAILAVISDTHGGSKGGLLNPETILFSIDPEGNPTPYNPALTASQEYLWKIYTWGIEETIRLAGKDKVYLLHIGDQTHGNKYPQTLVSTRLADQPIIASFNLKPWLQQPNLKTVRLVVGTAAHNFSEGSADILIQNLLQGAYRDTDVATIYHGLLTVNGALFDISHHGAHPGSRNWLKGNVARFYLRDIMQRAIMRGEKPPDVVLRGHYHQDVYEYLETEKYASRLYIMPSFSVLDDHAMQASSSPDHITNGTLAIEIEDGRIIEHYRFYKTIDVRAKETL